METVVRRWTIATWLVAGHGSETERIALAVDRLGADVVLVQSIREDDAREVAAAEGDNVAWALSHYPRSRLFPGSAVGLAVITPHRITSTGEVVVGDHRSTWSRRRRIAQFATVERADHTGYSVAHAVAAAPPLGGGDAPPIRVHPQQVGVDDARAVELPEGATRVSSTLTRPIEGAAPLLAVTFELPWVRGDLPLG